MARTKVKDSEARSFRIRKDIGKRLDDYSENSMIPRTAIVEKAIEEYLDKVAPVKKKNKKWINSLSKWKYDIIRIRSFANKYHWVVF